MCVKPDGTLSPSAEMILRVCESPATIEQMAQATNLRAFRIKTAIRELTGAGLLVEQDDCFAITPAGTTLLQGQSG